MTGARFLPDTARARYVRSKLFRASLKPANSTDTTVDRREAARIARELGESRFPWLDLVLKTMRKKGMTTQKHLWTALGYASHASWHRGMKHRLSIRPWRLTLEDAYRLAAALSFTDPGSQGRFMVRLARASRSSAPVDPRFAVERRRREAAGPELKRLPMRCHRCGHRGHFTVQCPMTLRAEIDMLVAAQRRVAKGKT